MPRKKASVSQGRKRKQEVEKQAEKYSKLMNTFLRKAKHADDQDAEESQLESEHEDDRCVVQLEGNDHEGQEIEGDEDAAGGELDYGNEQSDLSHIEDATDDVACESDHNEESYPQDEGAANAETS